jgi:hypothetical protein
MVADSIKVNNLQKYIQKSEDELVQLISSAPYFLLPKIALLIKKQNPEDKQLLHHVALASYDRIRLQQFINNSSFFFG